MKESKTHAAWMHVADTKAANVTLCVMLGVSIVWQGSFFPIQYIWLLALLLLAITLTDRPFIMTTQVWLLLGLVIHMSLSLMLCAADKPMGLRELLRYMLLPISMLFFLVMKEYAESFIRALYTGLLIVAALGLLVYEGDFWIPVGIIQANGRLQSTIQYANTTALLMLIGILYSAHYFISTQKWRYPLYLAVFAYCLYATGSRTTFVLAFGIAVVYTLSLLKRHARWIVMGVLILLAGFLFMQGGRIVRISLTEPTFIERVITWQDGIRLVLQRPFFGLGLGDWQTEQFLYQSAPYAVRYVHNYYVQLLLDGGIIALLLFALPVMISLWQGWKGKSIHFFVILAVVLHIFVDIDMTYGGVIVIIAFSMAQIPPIRERVRNINQLIRLSGLVPAALLLLMWGAEFRYTPTNPFAIKEAAARALIKEELYAAAIIQTEELLRMWQFNEEYQEMYRVLLSEAEAANIISSEEKQMKWLELERKLNNINPLYTRYIAEDARSVEE